MNEHNTTTSPPWPCAKHEIEYGRWFPECPDCQKSADDMYLGNGPEQALENNSSADDVIEKD